MKSINSSQKGEVMRKHYVVGSEGDAGSIVKRFLHRSGAEVISIDLKLGNGFPEDIEPGNYLYIETPPKTHAQFILFGRDKGLKTFVEKPLIYSRSELPEPTPLFCNFNMEYLSIPVNHFGPVELSRYCVGKPGYLRPGDRGVILDLMPHLLSVFPLFMLNEFSVLKVSALKENGVDIFATVFLRNPNIVKFEIGYGSGNLILIKYSSQNRIPIIYDWLPEESWWDGIRRFWTGETNTEKALRISYLIEEMYRELR